ncbi:MAG: hypothetical protein AUG51_04010 [Acidobacteria bacterium 13_1_20CM_3_53_8]|nr:MAG: hypothetical protein AUG51_04010 [Acidobacteria bacterium 13_1_20CM_3_53_8]
MNTLERLEEAEKLFHAALEREPQELDLFLSESCGGDSALRKEVESLLTSYYRDEEFLQSPAFKLSAAELADRALGQDEEASAVGKRVGTYRLVREIGRGGMGAVYLAVRDDGQYEQQVAVKLIKRGMDTDSILRRFRNERQILANLVHPNIARLLDGGTNSDGLPFLVMEYVEGQSIDAYADTHKLSTAERLKMFRIVCAAVQYAHQNRVIHRDIKPGNILVDREGTPKLLDFGIAKLLHSDLSTPITEATSAALRVLTPEYASPEQVLGEPVTTATDIYSLGVVLYELLTGHRPYRFEKRHPDEITKVVCHQEPEKPSIAISRVEEITLEGGTGLSTITPASVSEARESDPERLRRRLRGDLDNIVLMALRKEPRRRYASAEQFSEDIRRHLNGLPIAARKDTLFYRGVKFFKRNKGYAVYTLAVALICLLLGVFLALFTVRIKTRESIAVLPFVNSSDDPNMEYISDGFTDGLIDSLSRLPRLNVPGHNSVFRYKGRSIDPQSAGRDLRVETVLTGSVMTDGDNILVTIALFESGNNQSILSKQYRGKSSDIQTMQAEIEQDVSHRLGLLLGDEQQRQLQRRGTSNTEAYNFYLKGNYSWNKRTVESLYKAIEYFQKAIEIDPDYALAYSGLANSYSLLGAYRVLSPDQSFAKAKVAAKRALEINPTLPEGHTSLALIVWLYDWDWGGADSEFRRAIELNPNYPLAHHWYGLFLGEMGRFDEAVAEEKRALQLDPVSVPIIADLGRVYFFARRYDEALEQFMKAYGTGTNVGDFSVNFSDLYEQLGKMDALAMPDNINLQLKQAIAAGSIKTYWRNRLERYEQKPPNWANHYPEAEFLARLGENGRAIEQLNSAYEAHDHLMTQLKVNPAFDGLRSDPRFDELLRRMNLAD